MLIISKENIDQVITMTEAIDVSKEALLMYARGKVTVPNRLHVAIPKEDGTGLFMPSYAEELNALGIKIVSIFPKNNQIGKPAILSQMILMSGETGEVIAMIDGTYLTQLRTGALQGAATDVLANKNAKIGALIGTGAQAVKQLEAMLSVRQLDEVRVCAAHYEKTRAFVTKMQKEFAHFETNIIAVEHAADAINNADIITCITSSKTPLFDGLSVKKGAHINGLGSYTPDMQELPESLLQAANKIVFDSEEGAMAEAGDILIPLGRGTITKNALSGELGDVLSGKIKGRENVEDITVFKSVGTAVLDLVTAFEIYKKAMASNIGKKIELT